MSQTSSFLTEVYQPKYAHMMGQRTHTFAKIFEWLESSDPRNPGDPPRYYRILETGCARIVNNFSGDGESTVLWDAFVKYYDGKVDSVDLSPEHCQVARSLVSDKVTVHCSDSLAWFRDHLNSDYPIIDLLYLDSFDLDHNNPHPSAQHHLDEFLTALPYIKAATTGDHAILLVIDDNIGSYGKHRYVEDYLDKIGVKPFFKAYQVGWILDNTVRWP